MGARGKINRGGGSAEAEGYTRGGRGGLAVIGKEFWRLLCVARCVRRTRDAKILSRPRQLCADAC